MANGHRGQLTGVAIFTVGLAMAVPLFAQGPVATPDQSCPTQGLTEYQEAVKANPQSSLAHYCVAVLLFRQELDRPPNWWRGGYQASANGYRDALHGDGNPKWTKVSSYIGLGKIFDVTEQRERAVAQYQLAVQTNDNARGAVDEARECCKSHIGCRTSTDYGDQTDPRSAEHFLPGCRNRRV